MSPRAMCWRCFRPAGVCYCAHLVSIETSTRVVLLQHPRERDVPIGTARMASLCLPNAELHVGVRWDGSPALARALDDPRRPAVLLYPGEGAIDVSARAPAGPVTLIVIDGTWSQAKTVLRDNRQLRALPRYTFTPPAPSEYRIRKEPDARYVSTIEALVHVLGSLEGDPARFRALLAPFRAMVDTQIACAGRLASARQRKPRAPRPEVARAPSIFGARADDLVCVVGEANAWPYRSHERGAGGYADEIVHWVAHRIATGESFDFTVAPRNPLAPRTTEHVRLDEEALAAGGSAHDLIARWRSFARDTDVFCHWGDYAARLFEGAGGFVPVARVDVRREVRRFLGGKAGTLEDCVRAAGSPEHAPLARGRAGERVGQLVGLVRHLGAPLAHPDAHRT